MVENLNEINEFEEMKIETANIRSLIEIFELDTTLLTTIWDGIPALMFCKDDKNTVVRANQTFCNYLGKPKEEIEGANVIDLMKEGKDSDKYLSNDLSIFRTGKARHNIIEKMFDTGLTMRTDKFPIEKNGEIIGILGFSIILND